MTIQDLIDKQLDKIESLIKQGAKEQVRLQLIALEKLMEIQKSENLRSERH